MEMNGTWDERARRVRCEGSVRPESGRYGCLPIIIYALWAAPDEEARKARFGKVIPDSAGLAEHALWTFSLPPEQAAAWKGFPDGLLPVEMEMRRSFRFEGDPDTAFNLNNQVRKHNQAAAR